MAASWWLVCSGCQVQRVVSERTRHAAALCCSPVVSREWASCASRDDRYSPRIGRVCGGAVLLLLRVCCKRGRDGTFARENGDDLVELEL